jgi:altronate dehydratase small subunit
MENSDSRLLLLSPDDNVFIARVAMGPIPVGFKVARRAIAAGEKIIKWGAPIGSATRDIVSGGIVHVDNMKSDYLPTYTFEGEHRYAAGH